MSDIAEHVARMMLTRQGNGSVHLGNRRIGITASSLYAHVKKGPLHLQDLAVNAGFDGVELAPYLPWTSDMLHTLDPQRVISYRSNQVHERKWSQSKIWRTAYNLSDRAKKLWVYGNPVHVADMLQTCRSIFPHAMDVENHTFYQDQTNESSKFRVVSLGAGGNSVTTFQLMDQEFFYDVLKWGYALQK